MTTSLAGAVDYATRNAPPRSAGAKNPLKTVVWLVAAIPVSGLPAKISAGFDQTRRAYLSFCGVRRRGETGRRVKSAQESRRRNCGKCRYWSGANARVSGLRAIRTWRDRPGIERGHISPKCQYEGRQPRIVHIGKVAATRECERLRDIELKHCLMSPTLPTCLSKFSQPGCFTVRSLSDCRSRSSEWAVPSGQ